MGVSAGDFLRVSKAEILKSVFLKGGFLSAGFYG